MMINAKGETIYTNAEIAYEMGLTPATINAVAKRLFGSVRIPHWTLNDARLIVEYIKSISVEEDAKRLTALHNMVEGVMQGIEKMTDEETRKRVDKDVHMVRER
jgi:predicted transcriptional regulator